MNRINKKFLLFNLSIKYGFSEGDFHKNKMTIEIRKYYKIDEMDLAQTLRMITNESKGPKRSDFKVVYLGI